MECNGLEASRLLPRWQKRVFLALGVWLLIAYGAPTTAPTTKRPVRSSSSSPGFPIPPDSRPKGCERQTSDPEGRDFEDMKVSIIIPYRNEAWNHIKGSVASILHYTPAHYIAEIMFVSDGNGPKALFEDKIRKLSPLINFLVMHPGVGLITAKMRAVAASAPEASVVVFLEPHIRVNREWLQPLLTRLRKYPHVLAMPVLDAIPQDDFVSYLVSVHGHWRFEWNLNLIYTNPSEKTEVTSEPWPSPATSGGIFAIAKDWWNKLGFYDDGMVGWGGDHVEASMKVWRCGGHIDVIPCSRIGHLFRDPSRRPYDVPVDQVVHNYARIAHVWLDEHIDSFLKMKPETRGMDVGDLSKAREQRAQLQCKNMSWYLEHVDHEMNWEIDKICIPGCSRKQLGKICCKGQAAPQRSTIDRTIRRAEFKPVDLPAILRQHEDDAARSSSGNGHVAHHEL